MKWPIGMLLMFLTTCSCFSEEPLRIALVNSNVPSNWVANGLAEQCHDIVLTRNAAKADFFVEVQLEGNRIDLTVFNSDEDAVFWSETIKTHNAVKDMCQYIGQKGKKKKQ